MQNGKPTGLNPGIGSQHWNESFSNTSSALSCKTKRLRITVDIVSAVVILLFVALFLFRSSQVMHYRWNWKPVVASFFNPRGILLKGFLTTIRLSIWSSIIAFFIGTVVGVGRLVRNRFFRLLSGLYVSLIRNLPPLVLVFIFYFFFSSQLLDPLGIDQAARNAAPLVQRLLSIFYRSLPGLPPFFRQSSLWVSTKAPTSPKSFSREYARLIGDNGRPATASDSHPSIVRGLSSCLRRHETPSLPLPDNSFQP